MPSRLHNGQNRIHDFFIKRCPNFVTPLLVLFMVTSLIMSILVTLSASITPSVYFFGFSGTSSGGNSVASASASTSVQVGLWGYCSGGASAKASLGPISASKKITGGCSSPQMAWSFDKSIPITSSQADRFQIFMACLVIFHLIHIIIFVLLFIFWIYTCYSSPDPVYNFCRRFINRYRKFPFLGRTNFDKEMQRIEDTFSNHRDLKTRFETRYMKTMFRRAPRNLTKFLTVFTLLILTFLDMPLVLGAYFSVNGVPGPAFYLQITLTILMYFSKGLLSTQLIIAENSYENGNPRPEVTQRGPNSPLPEVRYNAKSSLPALPTGTNAGPTYATSNGIAQSNANTQGSTQTPQSAQQIAYQAHPQPAGTMQQQVSNVVGPGLPSGTGAQRQVQQPQNVQPQQQVRQKHTDLPRIITTQPPPHNAAQQPNMTQPQNLQQAPNPSLQRQGPTQVLQQMPGAGNAAPQTQQQGVWIPHSNPAQAGQISSNGQITSHGQPQPVRHNVDGAQFGQQQQFAPRMAPAGGIPTQHQTVAFTSNGSPTHPQQAYLPNTAGPQRQQQQGIAAPQISQPPVGTTPIANGQSAHVQNNGHGSSNTTFATHQPRQVVGQTPHQQVPQPLLQPHGSGNIGKTQQTNAQLSGELRKTLGDERYIPLGYAR